MYSFGIAIDYYTIKDDKMQAISVFLQKDLTKLEKPLAPSLISSKTDARQW